MSVTLYTGNDDNHTNGADASNITTTSSIEHDYDRHKGRAASVKITSNIVVAGIVGCIVFVVGVAFVTYAEHGNGFLGIQEYVRAHQEEEGNIEKVESFFDVLCKYSPIKFSIGK